MAIEQRFVTGITNYAGGHGPLVMIGQCNLVDAVQLMPLVSTPHELLAISFSPLGQVP